MGELSPNAETCKPRPMLHPRRVDRLAFAAPLQLKSVARVTIRFGADNKLAKSFIRDYVPLMAYGNPHIQFSNECVEGKRETCKVQLEDGSSRDLNLKFYLYPQQLLQRILDLSGSPNLLTRYTPSHARTGLATSGSAIRES